MMDYTINAVERDRSGGHEAIARIANNTDKWSVSAQAAIVRIEKKLARFFVQDVLSGERAEVGVVREKGQGPYLRTFLNGKWSNHLLALPSPVDCKFID